MSFIEEQHIELDVFNQFLFYLSEVRQDGAPQYKCYATFESIITEIPI